MPWAKADYRNQLHGREEIANPDFGGNVKEA
jgi:hypothetical protein